MYVGLVRVKSGVVGQTSSLWCGVPFSNGFRDYHFWTILHRKGVPGNESYGLIHHPWLNHDQRLNDGSAIIMRKVTEMH
ncbi:hypothetical protein AVEN_168362-1 [Araneus ventricosus]|uniref:Uncharacterized protein n=1 Tax=Araneus ventricosus TaxID=182803 RepID=A0A4Y2QQA0_ARAVE|nr:hypothetical protein AVEN_168362-1 [Araneus ventricosus]